MMSAAFDMNLALTVGLPAVFSALFVLLLASYYEGWLRRRMAERSERLKQLEQQLDREEAKDPDRTPAGTV